MKKIITSTTIAATVIVLGATTGAQAGSPTCADYAGTGWNNHGEHVLTYVEAGETAGGAPAHLDGHAPPGASFCLGLDDHRPVGGG